MVAAYKLRRAGDGDAMGRRGSKSYGGRAQHSTATHTQMMTANRVLNF